MKNTFLLFLIAVFSFLIISSLAFASTTKGTIDSVNHHAWGENIGWVDFANVQVSDSALSGSAYGENVGWVDLSTVTNNSEGILSGYAWGENVGWVDFSKVTIDSSGVFSGSAYGENIGWIIFGTGSDKVSTDWRPASSRTTPSVSSANGQSSTSGGRMPTLCPAGSLFSVTTGLPCTIFFTPNVSGFSSGSGYCPIITILKITSKGNQVKCLQQKLKIFPVDGIFGKKTKREVVSFQKKNKLKPDGVVGLITRRIINQLNK